MSAPWMAVDRMSDDAFRALRRRAIFDCCKWDPQVEDACTLAHYPLVMTGEAWSELTALAEALARETLALERELVQRPELHARLGLPRRARAALERAKRNPPSGIARLARFDFHYTTSGWRISEVNSDVPGGLNEASGFPALVAPHYANTVAVGDPSDAYVTAILQMGRPQGPPLQERRPQGPPLQERRPQGPPRQDALRVGLLHATAYSDDNQMMTYLARRFQARGADAVLASPANVSWREGRAWLDAGPRSGFADVLIRFFPADWLSDLPESGSWHHFYAGNITPLSNPATALLTQSKRCPLVWHELDTPLPVWRALLPETRDPREVSWRGSPEWVLKPALGRVGEDVAISGLVTPKDLARIEKQCGSHPEHWVAQRRFDAEPLEAGGELVYPCVGVYTVDDRVAGAYGRLAPRALIDGRAADAAVLTAMGAMACS